MYSFMSGKSYELYSMMLTCLKENAAAAGLELKPKIISCDFEKGAIKAFKIHAIFISPVQLIKKFVC